MSAAQSEARTHTPTLEVADAEKIDTGDANNGLEELQLSQTNPIPVEKSWKTDEQQIVPKNNLPLVFFSLLLATFLVRYLSLPPLTCTLIDAFIVCRPPWTKPCTLVLLGFKTFLLKLMGVFQCCDCTTYDRRGASGRAELLMGWKVRGIVSPYRY